MSSGSKIYVGHLSPRTERRDLEELFEKFGRVNSVELKHGGFAFVEFEDPRDADDAVKQLNNYMLDGQRISVEWSRRSGGPGSDCFLCGQTGHWARECPDAREKGMDVKSGRCFKCGELGHLARYCRGSGGGGGGGGGSGSGGPSYREDYGRRGPPGPPPRGYGSRRSPPPYGHGRDRDPYYDNGYPPRGRSRSPGYGGGYGGSYGGGRGRSRSPYYGSGGGGGRGGRSPSPYGGGGGSGYRGAGGPPPPGPDSRRSLSPYGRGPPPPRRI